MTTNIEERRREEALGKFAEALTVRVHEVIDFYNHWAENYDEDSEKAGFRGPELLADFADQYMPDKCTSVIDMCAGTGRVAEELRKRGFVNMDALDGSVGMLQIAKKKKLYSDYFCECLVPGQRTTVPSDQYGAVVSQGTFVGHIKPEVADEFLRVLRPGGHCFITTREEYFYLPVYKDKLESYITNLKEWKLLEKTVLPNYFGDLNGVIFVLQKDLNLTGI